MNLRGEVLNRSLSEVRFGADGGSVQLFLTDTVPPYATVVLVCENLLAFHVHRTAGDGAPYFLGEVRWQPLAGEKQAQALARLGYSFCNERGGILEPEWEQAIHLHFEGSLCGDIICQNCSLREEEPGRLSSSVG
jgi:hypothetical protein